MAKFFNIFSAHSRGTFLGGAVRVIGVISLLAVFLYKYLEAERKKQEAERLETERKKQEAERLETERKKQEAERLEAERKKQEAERLEAERKKQEAERLETERKKQEAERLEAESKKQEAERLEDECKKQESEHLEAERKKQEAERLEAECKKQKAERLEAERKKQEAERKAKTVLTPQEIYKYWNFAKSEYNKFKMLGSSDDEKDRAARKEIALRILKMTSSRFTQTELNKQYHLMRCTYIEPSSNAEERFSYWKVLKAAYEELSKISIRRLI